MYVAHQALFCVWLKMWINIGRKDIFCLCINQCGNIKSTIYVNISLVERD